MELRIPVLNTKTAPQQSLADNYSSAGTSRWSQAISARYHLNLSSELKDWFDSGVCDSFGQSEFCEPAHPEQLLVDAPECIWPGLMPPDVLPLVGNGLGDWLCGRVSALDTIDEIVYWYHGGGDYLPYGNRLAEAIIFDTLAERLPGRRQLHAVPAERILFEHQAMVSGSLVAWALQQLPNEVAAVLDIDAPPSRVADELLRNNIAMDAVRCDAVLAALDNELRVRVKPADAIALGVTWDRDIAKWMFDTSTIPGDMRKKLTAWWGVSQKPVLTQDWETVEKVCTELSGERSDLGWVHDCLGWAAQRRGDLDLAGDHYLIAAKTSVFTDQSVRFRTHFDSERIAKFSVARLIEIGQAERLDSRYLEALCQADQPHWRERVASYWLDQLSIGGMKDEERYQAIYRAGWDVGCDSMSRYRELLNQLADAATDARQFARAEVARTHAACIDDRYRR